MNKKIGIIGFGNMGSAIAEGIKNEYKVFVFDKDKKKTENLLGISVSRNAKELVKKVDAVILAVKPQDFDNVLDEIKAEVKNKLVISIAAGITTHYIEKQLGMVRVVRVMPNLPAKIGKGMACLCKGNFSTEEDLNFAQKLFGKFGQSLIIEEKLIDAATAVSGSGPGYFYYLIEGKGQNEIKKFGQDFFIPALSASAEKIGFSKEQAKILAEATAEGSLAFLESVHISPAGLAKQVASKGGTTEAGLEVLNKGGSLEDAVKAALKRAKELSK